MTVRLRVLSYNISYRRGDPAHVAAVIRSVAPDVAILQEAPRHLRWRTKSAALACASGLVVASGGLPALGNLLLTSLRIRVHRAWSLRFPLTPGRHLRGTAFAECSVGRVRTTVVGSHLSTDPTERPAQARLLRDAMAGSAGSLIFGGDLNEEPGGPAWHAVADGLVDAAAVAGAQDRPTFSCAAPRRRIDAIFVDQGITVRGYDLVDTPLVGRASDHFPIVADLELPADPRRS